MDLCETYASSHIHEEMVKKANERHLFVELESETGESSSAEKFFILIGTQCRYKTTYKYMQRRLFFFLTPTNFLLLLPLLLLLH